MPALLWSPTDLLSHRHFKQIQVGLCERECRTCYCVTYAELCMHMFMCFMYFGGYRNNSKDLFRTSMHAQDRFSCVMFQSPTLVLNTCRGTLKIHYLISNDSTSNFMAMLNRLIPSWYEHFYHSVLIKHCFHLRNTVIIWLLKRPVKTLLIEGIGYRKIM